MTPALNGDKPVVLVADDDRDILELVAFRLERAGYDAVTANDGAEALDVADTRAPDLAVLDVMMPRMTGLDVCRELRADSRTASMAVLLLTARAPENDIEHGFAWGGDDYLNKPFSPRELASRVRAVLARSSR